VAALLIFRFRLPRPKRNEVINKCSIISWGAEEISPETIGPLKLSKESSLSCGLLAWLQVCNSFKLLISLSNITSIQQSLPKNPPILPGSYANFVDKWRNIKSLS
jgi:hypothetical protein